MRLPIRTLAVGVAASLQLAMPLILRSQSLLDRSDNISADWVGNTGTLYFNFVHRFSESPPPERKVTNFPTFLVATGIASKGLAGVNYATNSALAARYPNEWEFFARYAPLQQETGAPLDVGAQLDYNLAVKGMDGELSIARREGPVRLVAVSRLIADTLGGNNTRLAFGGGGTIRFGRFIALAADATTLMHRANGEQIAWSAGLHIALPNTPHTLSLHVSNATTSTLQGLTRGGGTRRYGFEFTIPIHMGRFTSSPEAPTPSTARAPAAEPAPTPPSAPAPSAVPIPAQAPPSGAAPTPVPAKPSPVDTAALNPQPGRGAVAIAAPVPAITSARTSAPRPSVHTTKKVITARMKGQAYLPAHMEISTGTTVTWKNLDALIHTVTAVDNSFNSGVIVADGSYSHTFAKPGTYQVYCVAHPFMKATIVVK